MFCSVAVLIIGAGIFGSLSRSGWFCALLSSLLLFGIYLAHQRAALFLFSKSVSPCLVMSCFVILLLLLLFSSIFLTGSGRTNQADLRLAQTSSELRTLAQAAASPYGGIRWEWCVTFRFLA